MKVLWNPLFRSLCYVYRPTIAIVSCGVPLLVLSGSGTLNPLTKLARMLMLRIVQLCSAVLQQSTLGHSQRPRRDRSSDHDPTIQRAGLSGLLRSHGKLPGRRGRVQHEPGPMLATHERWRLRSEQLLLPAWNRQLSAPGALRRHYYHTTNDYYNNTSVGYYSNSLQLTNATATRFIVTT